MTLVIALGAGCSPGTVGTATAADEYRVNWVVDGDTIELAGGKRVRYLGIDTPEVRKRIGGRWQYLPEPFATEAKKLNDDLVRNKNVKLEFDIVKEDKYGRWLAYVYVDGKMVNEELLRRGYAYTYHIPPNVRHVDRLIGAQNEARDNKRGLWGSYKIIDPRQAKNNIGKFQAVRGVVLDANRSRGALFIDFEGGFKAVIFNNNLVFFEKEGINASTYYTGKFVEVIGKIKYVDGPRIIIDHPSQISVL